MKVSIGIWVLGIGFIIGGLPPAHAAPGEKKAVDTSAWRRVLHDFVDENGFVDYASLKKNRKDLNDFLRVIRAVNPDQLNPQGKKAFWINAYNAITLDVVARHYPVKSIRRINFGLVWKVPRAAAGKKYSLEQIEHKILRPMGDPRIHFAINCASIGCPPLRREPFEPETLDAQLDAAARDFIHNPLKVRLDKTTTTLWLSAIFDWFEEDFLRVAPDLKSYVKRYMSPEDKAFLDQHEVEVKFLDYDWGLNEQKGRLD